MAGAEDAKVNDKDWAVLFATAIIVVGVTLASLLAAGAR